MELHPRTHTQLKVAIVMPNHWSALLGGAELQVRYLSEAVLDHPGLTLRYFVGKVDPDFSHPDYDVVELKSPFTPGTRLARLAGASRLYRELSAYSPDVIYQRVGSTYTGVTAFMRGDIARPWCGTLRETMTSHQNGTHCARHCARGKATGGVRAAQRH